MMETETKEQHVAQLPRPGEVIEERYRLIRSVASGGMGVIMLAEQLRTGRDVAVKLLHPHIAAREDFAERFMREVDVATRFDHPHIVRVYDVGETDEGVLYLVMELLDGEELKDLIEREAPLSAGRAIDIALQFLDGLAEAHEQGVVHRDFKPANVFVQQIRRGREHVKLLDFGIAKLANSEESDITATGMITGTPAYIAPETLMQDEQSNPCAVDVYAAGLVLLEMMTGRRVFQGNGAPQTLLQQLKKPVRIPEKIAATGLGDVIRKATRKHPADRFKDADEMYAALEAAREATPEDLLLDASEVPGPTADTSPSMLERLGEAGTDADLEMLREVDGAETYVAEESEELAPMRGDSKNTDELARVKTGIDIPNPSTARRAKRTSSGGGVKVAIAVVLVALLAGGGYWWFTTQGSDSQPDPASETPIATDPTVAAPSAEQPVEPSETDDSPAPVVAFEVTSEPPGASILAGDEVLGTSSATLEFAQDELPVHLTLEKEGYESAGVDLTADGDTRLSVELRKQPAPERAPTPTRTADPSTKEPSDVPDDDQDEDRAKDIDKMVDQYLPDE